jgi:hypothetical protein
LNGEATRENWDIKAVTQVNTSDLGRIKTGILREEAFRTRKKKRTETKKVFGDRVIGK